MDFVATFGVKNGQKRHNFPLPGNRRGTDAILGDSRNCLIRKAIRGEKRKCPWPDSNRRYTAFGSAGKAGMD
jgi:hypothetical protein